MTEDIFILDSHTEIFVWVGQQVDPKKKPQVLAIGEVLEIHSTRLTYKTATCTYRSSASLSSSTEIPQA